MDIKKEILDILYGDVGKTDELASIIGSHKEIRRILLHTMRTLEQPDDNLIKFGKQFSKIMIDTINTGNDFNEFARAEGNTTEIGSKEWYDSLITEIAQYTDILAKAMGNASEKNLVELVLAISCEASVIAAIRKQLQNRWNKRCAQI